MNHVIQVNGLRKSYGNHIVLKGLNFQIEKGEVFSLLGVNGAGKTTSLECIEGLKKYDSGTIIVKGKMGIQLQSSSLPAHIKPMEAIKLFAKWNTAKIDYSMLHTLGMKKAVALRPITSAKAVLPYLETLDMVLVMTVEPGFGGQKFMEGQLDTIREVRGLIDRYHPACELEVDGGIAPGTAERVIEAGATVLVAGSAVYGADDPAAAIAALRM